MLESRDAHYRLERAQFNIVASFRVEGIIKPLKPQSLSEFCTFCRIRLGVEDWLTCFLFSKSISPIGLERISSGKGACFEGKPSKNCLISILTI